MSAAFQAVSTMSLSFCSSMPDTLSTPCSTTSHSGATSAFGKAWSLSHILFAAFVKLPSSPSVFTLNSDSRFRSLISLS